MSSSFSSHKPSDIFARIDLALLCLWQKLDLLQFISKKVYFICIKANKKEIMCFTVLALVQEKYNYLFFKSLTSFQKCSQALLQDEEQTNEAHQIQAHEELQGPTQRNASTN